MLVLISMALSLAIPATLQIPNPDGCMLASQ